MTSVSWLDQATVLTLKSKLKFCPLGNKTGQYSELFLMTCYPRGRVFQCFRRAGRESSRERSMSDQLQAKLSSGFGHYLVSVAERDVDLLLMEEFHASDAFVSWFCAKLDLPDVRGDGAWHSVSDSDGETDLLLRVNADGQRVAVFIENKVAALEQHEQAKRYHIRAAREQQQGKCDSYVTVICAPKRYLSYLSARCGYRYWVSYEDIATWFSEQPDRRSAWRRQVIEHAIEQARRGHHLVLHMAHTAFPCRLLRSRAFELP